MNFEVDLSTFKISFLSLIRIFYEATYDTVDLIDNDNVNYLIGTINVLNVNRTIKLEL